MSPLPAPPPCVCGSGLWCGLSTPGEFACVECGRRWFAPPPSASPAMIGVEVAQCFTDELSSSPRVAFDGQLRHREQLVRELSEVLNRNGVDAQLNRPDYVLAEYVLATLVALGQAAEAAERHRMGGGTDLVAVTEIPVRGPR